MSQTTFPEFVAIGEALTDMIRTGPETWQAKVGGAGWNVSRVMVWLGVSSAFAGAISQDNFGQDLWDASAAAGLDLRFLQRKPYAPLLAIVHETHPPQYYFIGNDSADLHFDPLALPGGWEHHAKWAYFGGISLAREPLTSRLLDQAERLKQGGVRIAYDPNFRVLMDERYDATLHRMACIADVIKISDEDLVGLFRTKDEQAAFARLREHNPSAVYLYTRGADGASIHVGNEAWKARPPKIEVVDTVGAGDASLGGLLVSMSRNPNAGWDTHLRASIATGAGACLVAGGGLPGAEVIAELATRVVPERL